MGAESSRSSKFTDTSACNVPTDDQQQHFHDECVKKLLLNEEETRHVVTTWKQVESNIAKVGVITFLGLFETHPAVQSVFLPLNNLSQQELGSNAKLEAHALKVMNFIQKVIARIDNPEKVYHLLDQLGTNHFYYGVQQDYIDLVGPQFVNAIRPLLETTWISAIEDSWLHLFASMSDIMKKAINQAQIKHGSIDKS